MERHTHSIKLGIGIPTYNRYDLLQSSLLLYARDFMLSASELPFFIVDNGSQGVNFPYAKIHTPDKNMGVAASWNYLCDRIFQTCDYALILNDDIYLGKSLLQVLSIIQKKPERFIRATPDWCAFILPKTIYEKVGRFDEVFYPAYYEDKSYEYRMKLMGIPYVKSPDLNPYQYRSSQSLEKDHSILEAAKKNKARYIEMWGGEPEKEKFKIPYGKSNS